MIVYSFTLSIESLLKYTKILFFSYIAFTLWKNRKVLLVLCAWHITHTHTLRFNNNTKKENPCHWERILFKFKLRDKSIAASSSEIQNLNLCPCSMHRTWLLDLTTFHTIQYTDFGTPFRMPWYHHPFNNIHEK